ncbi:MAG: exodeoxyribonuclease alpha subunit [Ferruginibacter sp.]|nr:exodeoxyribonuclease alpha subunit [Ferruginibacter sp.]
MQTINDVHQQFAEFFKSELLKPYAYLVSKRLAEGHICVDLKDIKLLPEEVANVEKYGTLADAKIVAEEPMVSSANGKKQPFILHQNRLYLQRYYAYESAIVESIRSFIAIEKEERDNRMQQLQSHKDLIMSLSAGSTLQPVAPEENADWQLVAAIISILNNFTIITGGPGTGKTTTVAKILAILYAIHPSLKVALAAPTGKAAVRMAESLKASRINIDPSIKEKFQSLVPGTIHRLLKYIPDSPYFKHDKTNPLVYDLVIVDEASMIDVALFAKLLAAIGPQTRIILLGDKDQLASVEAGSLLGDLCQAQQQMNALSASTAEFANSFIPGSEEQIPSHLIAAGNNILFEHIIELKRSHRFTAGGGIGKFSKAIIHSRLKEVEDFIDKNNDREVTIDCRYSEELFNRFVDDYASYITEKDIAAALGKLNRLRVLCAVREGPFGVDAVNRKITNWLVGKKLINTTTEFYLNRPIIVTRNFPDLKLFNGDVGIIRPDSKGSLKAWFEDTDKNLKSVLPGYISSAETVFAMTIHKSQGSEYEKVLVILPPNADQPLLTRELLYTAITRSKHSVLLQASRESVLYTASRSVQRISGIMDRFGYQ